MDLEAARKSLSKQSRFSPKKIAFGVVVGLVFVAGIGLRVRHYLDEAPPQNEPAAVEAPASRASPCAGGLAAAARRDYRIHSRDAAGREGSRTRAD